jgi:trigger factor
MNVSFNKRDAVSGVLKVEIAKEDYAGKVETSLQEARRKADVPGFRKGMAPMGIINKRYRKSILSDAINELTSNSVCKYIEDNAIQMIGGPLSNETEHPKPNFDTQENFEFYFDIPIIPDIHVELSKNDHIPYYKVVIDDALLDKRIDFFKMNNGSFVGDAEEVEEKDMVKGTAIELSDASSGEEGSLVVEAALLTPKYINDEETRRVLIGAKKGTTLTINLHKAFGGNETEIAAFLKIDKEMVAGVNGDFSFVIEDITRFKAAELNQALYDRLFNDGLVVDEAMFRERIRESIRQQYIPQSEYRFKIDMHCTVLGKAGNIALADDMVKRWFLYKGEYKTLEQVETEYPRISRDLKWQFIRDSILKANSVDINEEDLLTVARQIVREQFAQYGIKDIPDDVVSNSASKMINNDDTTLHIVVARATENKLVDWIKNAVSIDVTDVSIEELAALCRFEEQE